MPASSSRSAPGVLRSAGMGGVIGAVLALAITYLPLLLAGDGFYESTDSLVVFSLVLVPLGAGAGALLGAIRRTAGTHRPGARVAVAVAAFIVLVLVLWQVWAHLTGAPALL